MVKWFGAVQSQDFPGAKWALGQRLPEITDQTIDQAYNAGEILRTHVMRPTWHFVHPTDSSWLLTLTAPQVSKAMNSYNKKLELTPEVFTKTQQIFIRLLQGKKQLTRQELKTELTHRGIRTDIQRLAHIVMQAELDQIICSGPLKGKQFIYMLFTERVPRKDKRSHDEALYELTKRYFTSHGPAQLQDFVWWSGLTTTQAKLGITMNMPKLTSETIEGKLYWFFNTTSSALPATTYLLPNYDEYTVAYADRSLIFNTAHSSHLDSRGNSIFQNVILNSGKVIGIWKRTVQKGVILVESTFFDTPTPEQMNVYKHALEQYRHFTSLPIISTEK